MGHVLGIDASTTATKAVLIDESGAVRGIGSSEYGFDVPAPLWSEQEPRLWWESAVLLAIVCAGAAVRRMPRLVGLVGVGGGGGVGVLEPGGVVVPPVGVGAGCVNSVVQA